MLFAVGWAVARASREPYRAATSEALEAVDAEVERAEEALFLALRRRLAGHEPPDLDWHFRPHMNHAHGVLLLSSSRNHRGGTPTAVEVLQWLAEHGPGSYGLVYLRDGEDSGARTGQDHANEFRVWRLLGGRVEELADPFLSPIVPRIDPTPYG